MMTIKNIQLIQLGEKHQKPSWS